jgi:general stress protein YciG
MTQDTKSGSSGTSNRGFASMDPALQREIASKGGRSVPPEERSFSKDRALAAEAGRKGGEASHGGRRPGTQPLAGNVAAGAGQASGGGAANDRARASEAGRKGGSH